MADLNNVYNALRAAHAAGDTEAASKLANYINQVQSAAAEPVEFVEAPEEKPLGGFWDTLKAAAKTFGLSDEAAAFAANPNAETRAAFIAAGDSKFRTVGFGEGENWAAFKQLLGGSLGQMVAPVAAATAGSFATPIAGVAAGFGTSAAQYQIQNLQRQAQEQERAIAEGRTPEELQLGKSLAASTAQAGLDFAQLKYFEKLFRALPFTRNLLLPEEEAVQQAADKLVDSYKAGTLKATPIGTVKDAAKGAAFEVPQEVAQTVLERWQAGLSLSDDEAQEEYKQAAIGAAILGPLMGGAAGYAGRAGERTAAQAEIERREVEAAQQREQGKPPPTTPAPPAPPAAPRETKAELEARLEREAREEYERQQALADLERREYNAQTLREAAEAEALAPVDEDAPYYPPAAREADVEVATEDLVATEAAPAPDVRTLALEAIKVKPTIKAISEATGLNQPKAAAIMRGFIDEGIVERVGAAGSKFKLVEPKAAETVEAKEAAAPAETAEPPVPKGYTRLWRSESGEPEAKIPDWMYEIPGFKENVVARGRWFSDADEARRDWYKKEAGANFVEKYIDIPNEQVAAYSVKNNPEALKFSREPDFEYFLPKDIADKAIQVGKSTKQLAETVTPITPPEAPSEPVSTRAGEAVAGATAGSPALPVQRGAPAGQEAARPEGAGVEPVGGVAKRVDEREGAVSPALTDDKTKNARAAGLDYVRSTGKVDALGLQKATKLKLPEVRALRDALIGSGAIVPVPGKKNFYQVFEDYRPAATKPVREDVQDDTDEAVIEEARARADARLRAKNAEAIKVQERADEASERAPAPQRRPTFKGVPKGTLAEDMRIAAAALDEEKAAAQLASLEQRINQAERRSSDKTLKPAERAEQRRLVKTLTDELRQRRSQRGLDLVGGSAKPSLSRAETEVLNSIKSAARFLNASGKMNDADRERYNAEIKKPKPDLAKLRKLVDKVASREDEDVGGIESNEDFYTTREQYELDEDGTYFYDTEGPDNYKPLRFRRGEGKGNGLSASSVQATVSRIVKGWKNAPKVNVVQSYTDLPGRHFPNTQGIYVDGEIYLVADNLSDVAEVKATLFHESLGHFGLEQVFGKRLKEVMLNLYRTNKAVRKQADQYLARFPDSYSNKSRGDQIALAVEEVLAEASAAGPKVKDASALRAAFNRVANLIRKFLNAMGFPVTYTNNEINEILIQAHGAVMAGQRKERIGDGTIKYQRRQAEERLSRVFDFTLTASKYNSKIGDGLRAAYGNIGASLREASMGFLQIKDSAEIWKKELPEIETTDRILESRGGTEAARREEVGNLVMKWYKMSNKISKKNPEIMDRFFKVANMTTVYQVDPLNDTDRAVLNKPVNKMSGQDRAAYDIIKEFDALPKELRDAYKELRAYYERTSAQMFDLLAKVVGEKAVDRLKAKYDSKRLRVYLPLWRDGDYWLTYTDQNNETITSAFNSEVDRTRAIEALKAQGITNAKGFTRLNEARRNGPLPTGFLGEVVSALEANNAPEYLVDAVYEAFLNYLPADSIRQQLQSREESYDMATGTTRYGKFGFEPDVFQAFANVANRMANQLTNLEYAVPIEESLSKVRQQAGGDRITDPILRDVYNNLVKQVNFIRNPQPNRFFDGASYFSYMWFIAGNISSALVNTTQLPMVVAPLLGGKYGYDKAYTAMEKAMKTYFKGGRDTNSDYTFGAATNLDPKYKKLYDTAVSRSIIRRSSGYEHVEARRTNTKDYVGMRAKVEAFLGWTFQNSERFNREVTLLAAFDLAYSRTGDINTAIEEAIKLTKDAHGSALAETGPRFFQQGFGKMMFTFKRFAQAQVYLLSRLFHQSFKGEDATTREVARSQLVGIFGAAFILAGVQGMPLYGLAEFLASLLMGDDDEPFDATGYVDGALSETGRKGLLNQLIGVDIASRTGFNGLIWREDYKRMSDVGPILYTLEQALGPSYAAAMSIGRGIGLFGEGEYQRAVEAIAPSFIRNGWKTLRYAEEGVRNKDGTPVVEDVGDYNLMMQAVGFAPSEVSYARERASSTAKLQDKLVKRRSSLLDKYYAAWQEQDAEGMQEALDDIKKFNAKNPQRGLAITQDTIRKSVIGRVTRQEQSVDGLYVPLSIRNRIAQILPGD